MIDPSDRIFHLKMPLFLLVFLIWTLTRRQMRYRKDIILMIAGLFLISTIGFLSAILQNSDIDYVFALGFFKSLSFLFLLLVIIDLDIQPDIILNKYSFLIPLATIPIYIITVSYPVLFILIYDFLVLNKDVAMISNRNFYGYELTMVYYKTSAILVFPLSYYCNRLLEGKKSFNSLFLVMLFFSSLIMSGTRANIVAGTVILIYYLYKYLKSKKNIVYWILAVLTFSCVLTSFILSLSFSNADESSDVKSGHYSSFLKTISDHFEYLIWGQGLGSKFYTSGSDAFAAQTELTYLDLVRFFGLPLACLFFALVIYPIVFLSMNKRINNRNSYAIIAFMTYLFIAGTNPLLVSSTGMLILIVMYSFLNVKIYKTPFTQDNLIIKK